MLKWKFDRAGVPYVVAIVIGLIFIGFNYIQYSAAVSEIRKMNLLEIRPTFHVPFLASIAVVATSILPCAFCVVGDLLDAQRSRKLALAILAFLVVAVSIASALFAISMLKQELHRRGIHIEA